MRHLLPALFVLPGALAGCPKAETCTVGSDLEPTAWFTDVDGDGFGSPAAPIVACDPPADRVENGLDCDDENGEVYPGSGPDMCNDLDDDCDGVVDEDGAVNRYLDLDSDGFGRGSPIVTCMELEGYTLVGDDCDDDNAASYPDAEELCDGLDNDCNGSADEVVRATCYRDSDGDGYGDPLTGVPSCEPACEPGSTSVSEDCDDANEYTYPNAVEDCDGQDNDCDAATFIDEGATCFAESIVFQDPGSQQIYMLSWDEVRHSTATVCGDIGYHLVWIDNQAEADYLLSFASSYTSATRFWTGVRWNGCAVTNTWSRVDDGSLPLFCGPVSGWETTELTGTPGPGVAALTASGLEVQSDLSASLPFFCELDP